MASVARAGARARPIITLTSDFGTRDSYVAEMKGVLLDSCPAAQLVDVTHDVPRHDALFASIVLERVVSAFAPGAVHVVVVDPGVGTARRLLAVRIAGQMILCPDNGSITWTWRRRRGGEAHEIIWRPPAVTATFHGRDILAPLAAMLANGRPLKGLARRIDDPVLLEVAPARSLSERVEVIHIDHFGNATTNLPAEVIGAGQKSAVNVKARSLGPIRRTYGDVARGDPLGLIGSSGLLEIAVREGSAAEQLELRVGDRVTVKLGRREESVSTRRKRSK